MLKSSKTERNGIVMDSKELIFEGFNAVKSAICGIESCVNGRSVIRVLFSKARVSKKRYEYSWLNGRAASLGFDLVICDESDVTAICNTDTHGGVVGIFSHRDCGDLTALINDAAQHKDSWYLSLEGIEDPYNLGFTIRSAYAFGCAGVVLPNRYIFGADGVVCRSSAGASERIPFYRCDLIAAARAVRDLGFSVCAACEKDAVSLCDHPLTLPLMLVVGGEKRGISSSLLSECTDKIRIDYARYAGSSLSAVSAAAVLAYEIAEKNGKIVKND